MQVTVTIFKHRNMPEGILPAAMTEVKYFSIFFNVFLYVLRLDKLLVDRLSFS